MWRAFHYTHRAQASPGYMLYALILFSISITLLLNALFVACLGLRWWGLFLVL